ncbi:MAG: LysR substrate-binding domain-containing protein [Azoarcus sp.]|jgi:LysR family nitrogen assimilation transcriptional regulator|nr:LysR substrate-binding domain-containing protein [Azoarcus sp.]MDD2874103.1 LysR substrate-binding domain-containing protein [Azoarcus sp.]MDX9837960.1 LysR substrate-binding domain-containing protein [Azoarcus sp.]
MDLRQLEYFVHVAELGSFTRASIALDIAQPALSRQIRLLEVELRQNLLIRNGRGVTTTEAGKLLLEHSRGVLHQIERAKEELARIRGASSGRVAVGLPPSLSKVLTVPLARAFREQMPDATLSISEGLSVSMQESLINGRLDIALLYNAAPSPEIDTTPLTEEDLFLIERRRDDSTSAPIRLAEVANLPLVIPGRPHSIRMLVEAEMANIGFHPKAALEVDGVNGILDLVADGAGSAVLSMNAVTTSGKAEALNARPITEPRLRSRLALAVSARRPTTATQQSMLKLLQKLTSRLLSLPG